MTTATVTKQLRKNYDKLAPLERFRLALAAEARGDDSEMLAIRDSAPDGTYRMMGYPYRGMWEGWLYMLLTCTGAILASGFSMLQNTDFAHQAELLKKKGKRRPISSAGDPAGEDFPGDFYAWWDKATDDAWEVLGVWEALGLVCQELGITAEQAIITLPGSLMVGFAVHQARIMEQISDTWALRCAEIAAQDREAEVLTGDALMAARRETSAERARGYAHGLWAIWTHAQGEGAPDNPFPAGELAPASYSLKRGPAGAAGLSWLTARKEQGEN